MDTGNAGISHSEGQGWGLILAAAAGDRPAFDQIRAALIAGYTETRAADRRVVDACTLARTCASVGWTMPRLTADDPINKSHIARAVLCAEMVLG